MFSESHALEVGRAAAAGADDGQVQLVVEVLAAENRRRARHDAGRHQALPTNSRRVDTVRVGLM